MKNSALFLLILSLISLVGCGDADSLIGKVPGPGETSNSSESDDETNSNNSNINYIGIEQGDFADGTEAGETITVSNGYAEENFHCDLNADGIEDAGEIIDFPDHTFAMKFKLTAGRRVDIPIEITTDSNFYLDWGDGTCVHSSNYDYVHYYEDPYDEDDEVIVRIIGSLGQIGFEYEENRFKFCENFVYTDNTLIEVVNLGDVIWTSLQSAFANCTELKTFSSGYTDTSGVTNIGGMFSNASKLANVDLSTLNTSAVTDMNGLFGQCEMLTRIDLSNFDTSNVTNMSGTFAGASSLTQLNLTNFNTSNVTNMRGMFYGLRNLTQLNLTNFNTSNVTNMGSMFGYMSNLTQLDLSGFDTSNVTSMEFMLDGLTMMNEIDLGQWETESIIQSIDPFIGSGSYHFEIFCTNQGGQFTVGYQTITCDTP